jgi:hypothetical protein
MGVLYRRLMSAFRKFLDHFATKSGDVVRLSARDQPSVCHDFLVDPCRSSISEICLDGWEGSQRSSLNRISFDERNRTVADCCDRFTAHGKGSNKVDRLFFDAQIVRVHLAARKKQRIESIRDRHDLG